MPFQAIPWEHDGDICLYEKDLYQLTRALEADPRLIYDEETNRVALKSYAFQVLTRVYFDFFPFKELDNGMLSPLKGWYIELPKSIIEPINSNLTFCNHLVRSPYDPLAYLETVYGKTYMTRIFGNNLHGFTCSLYVDCKLQ